MKMTGLLDVFYGHLPANGIVTMIGSLITVMIVANLSKRLFGAIRAGKPILRVRTKTEQWTRMVGERLQFLWSPVTSETPVGLRDTQSEIRMAHADYSVHNQSGSEEVAPLAMEPRLYPNLPWQLEMRLREIAESRRQMDRLKRRARGEPTSSDVSDESTTPQLIDRGYAEERERRRQLVQQSVELGGDGDSSITPQPSINSTALLAYSRDNRANQTDTYASEEEEEMEMEINSTNERLMTPPNPHQNYRMMQCGLQQNQQQQLFQPGNVGFSFGAASDSKGGLPRSFSQVGHLIDNRNHMPSVPDMPNATYEDGRLFQNSQNDTAHQMHMLQQEQHMAQLQYHNEQGYHNDRAEENNYYEDTRNPIQQYSEELHEPQIYQTEEHQHNSTYDLDQNQMLEENRAINGLAGDVENSQVLAGHSMIQRKSQPRIQDRISRLDANSHASIGEPTRRLEFIEEQPLSNSTRRGHATGNARRGASENQFSARRTSIRTRRSPLDYNTFVYY